MNHGATNLQNTGGGGKTTLNSFLQVLLAHNHTYSLVHLVQKYTAIFPLRMDLRNQSFTKKHDRRSQIYSCFWKGEKHSCSRQQLTKRSIQDALPRLNFPNATYTNFPLARRRRKRSTTQQQVLRKAQSVVVARKTRRRIARLEELREWEITKCRGDDLLCL
jgi:hypothetical protein